MIDKDKAFQATIDERINKVLDTNPDLLTQLELMSFFQGEKDFRSKIKKETNTRANIVLSQKRDLYKEIIELSDESDRGSEIVFELFGIDVENIITEVATQIILILQRNKAKTVAPPPVPNLKVVQNPESFIDINTGTLNRKAFSGSLRIKIDHIHTVRENEKFYPSNLRENPFLSVGIIEINNFNQLVYKYGKEAWANCMKEMIVRVKKALRNSDLVGSYSENKIIMALDGSGHNARLICEHIIDMVNEEPFKVKHPKLGTGEVQLPFSVNIGISQYPNNESVIKDPEDYLLTNANKNLIESKLSGKNKVLFSNELKPVK